MRFASLLVLVAAACNNPPGTQLVFNLDADLSTAAHFYDLPYPNDLRLDAQGHPDLRGFPNPNGNPILAGLQTSAMERVGWPVLPVAYLRFTGPIPARSVNDLVEAGNTSPILLIDIDDTSPEKGRLLPTVAQAGVSDDYLPINTLAVAARPGFVLAPKRRYAFVVKRSLGTTPLDVPPAFADLAAGRTPSGKNGAAARDLYAPLWTALAKVQILPTDVAGATVFTTGDVVQETFDLTTALVAKYSIQITNLAIDPDDGATQDGFCELVGKVTYPQFQAGMPPYDSGGLFDFSDGGLPKKQRDEDAPIRITLPFGEMPASGFPLVVYFHGSGGSSSSAVDRGPVLMAGGDFTKGKGPAYIHAKHGLANACSALPVNPERLQGASETAYLNLSNLAAFRDTFRQGVIEQRLFIEALRKLEIPPAVVAGCAAVKLPATATSFHFDEAKLVAQGQSMGGMYTNMISATEPRIKASVPTGAGGFWSYFILQTQLIANADILIGSLFNTDPPTFVHPGMVLFQAAEEPADPMVYMPRLAHRPLANHPTRPIYEPVGLGDSYFPTVVYDAVALAYQHQQAGDQVWPTMQPALTLENLGGIKPYPVTQNLQSVDGKPYTGIIVQYAGDGFFDPHAIYTQLDAVKYQYGCFLESFLKTGIAIVPAVQPLGSACP